MPAFEVEIKEREKAERLVQFVKNFFPDLSVEGRFVFALEMARFLKPEFDELKRRKEAKQNGQ